MDSGSVRGHIDTSIETLGLLLPYAQKGQLEMSGGCYETALMAKRPAETHSTEAIASNGQCTYFAIMPPSQNGG